MHTPIFPTQSISTCVLHCSTLLPSTPSTCNPSPQRARLGTGIPRECYPHTSSGVDKYHMLQACHLKGGCTGSEPCPPFSLHPHFPGSSLIISHGSVALCHASSPRMSRLGLVCSASVGHFIYGNSANADVLFLANSPKSLALPH